METSINKNLNVSIFRSINTILERDSTTSTYKFALLRAVIELIQENTPYTKKSDDFVEIPFLLLVEKWLIYYYGIFSAEKDIPQIVMTNSNLAIEKHIRKLIEIYKPLGGINSFYSDIRSGKVPLEFQEPIYKIFQALKDIMFKYPMKHLGNSVSGKHYTLFLEYKSKTNSINPKIFESFNLSTLIPCFGQFRISREYYDAFEFFGHFIIGNSGLISRWSDFSANVSKGKISKEFILTNLTQSIDNKRFTDQARKIALNHGLDKCIWSKTVLDSENLVIDHILPFSVFHNNDLWNLMPTVNTQNGEKSDKIPTLAKFLGAKQLIQNYWDTYMKVHPSQFKDELMLSLVGNEFPADWKDLAFNNLIRKAEYLKDIRGLREWK